jgi:hypothetical protein
MRPVAPLGLHAHQIAGEPDRLITRGVDVVEFQAVDVIEQLK